MKAIVAARQAAAAKQMNSRIETLPISSGQSNLQSIIATAAIAIGFAAFAFSVKYVLRSIAYDD